MHHKKAAIELSITTVVVIVIGISMLILGLVLVKNIFTGVIYNVDQINENVRTQINTLFNEKGENVVLYLPGNQATVSQGKSFGVAFGIKNNVAGEAKSSKFAYKIQASSVQKGCELDLKQANNYLILGDSGSFDLLPGKIGYSLVKIQPTSAAPLCEIKYDIIVTKDNQPYDSGFFILVVT